MISIFEFKDNYRAIGIEGERKIFYPKEVCTTLEIESHLRRRTRYTAPLKVRKINKTLEQYFKGE